MSNKLPPGRRPTGETKLIRPNVWLNREGKPPKSPKKPIWNYQIGKYGKYQRRKIAPCTEYNPKTGKVTIHG